MRKILFILLVSIKGTSLSQTCSSIQLLGDSQYVISGWVSVETPNPVVSYQDVAIRVIVSDMVTTSSTVEVFPSGPIIDGWQQITGIFKTTPNPDGVQIQLRNLDSSLTAYFDDVRLHPLNGNLKSFVYDAATQRLMAELDENNYATFYEYDQEGGLIRVKKETERGVYTIQETRSGNQISN